jgi:hypothetical protein
MTVAKGSPVLGRPLMVMPLPGTPTAPLATFLRGLGYRVDVPSRASPCGSGADVSPCAPVAVEGIEYGQARIGMLPWTPTLAEQVSDLGVMVMLLIRDPRDAAEAVRSLDAPAEPDSAEPPPPSDEAARVLAAAWASFDGWRTAPGVVVVRYEDVCPPRLGGDEARQVNTLVGLAADIAWRGSGFVLARAMLATHRDDGSDEAWSHVGVAWGGQSGCVSESAAAASREAATAWGYADQPEPVSASSQGALAGLLAALSNEHENVRDALTQRATAARDELRQVEAGARLLQGRLAAERAKLGPVKRCLAWLAAAKARAVGVAQSARPSG